MGAQTRRVMKGGHIKTGIILGEFTLRVSDTKISCQIYAWRANDVMPSVAPHAALSSPTGVCRGTASRGRCSG
jgi:hypothetical protein